MKSHFLILPLILRRQRRLKSITLEVNRFDKVIGIIAENEETKSIINNIRSEKKDISQVVDAILSDPQLKKNMSDSLIIETTDSKHKLNESLKRLYSEHVKQDNVSAEKNSEIKNTTVVTPSAATGKPDEFGNPSIIKTTEKPKSNSSSQKNANLFSVFTPTVEFEQKKDKVSRNATSFDVALSVIPPVLQDKADSENKNTENKQHTKTPYESSYTDEYRENKKENDNSSETKQSTSVNSKPEADKNDRSDDYKNDEHKNDSNQDSDRDDGTLNDFDNNKLENNVSKPNESNVDNDIDTNNNHNSNHNSDKSSSNSALNGSISISESDGSKNEGSGKHSDRDNGSSSAPSHGGSNDGGSAPSVGDKGGGSAPSRGGSSSDSVSSGGRNSR